MSLITQTTTQARGFALYVGITEQEAKAAGISLAQIAQELRQKVAELVPQKASETYAAIALAPDSATGSNLAITRLALHEPKATAALAPVKPATRAAKGVVVDLNRRRLFVDGRNANLTCKEFELLAYLIENEGTTISRTQIAGISERCGDVTPNSRTIDVHVRRLRSKISGYEDIIRTARGSGYRFDKHPDVLIEEL
jgi:DNA-binding response OmpR family regulator